MKYKILYISFLVFFLISCQKKQVFQPVYYSKSNYLENSKEYSKTREVNERKYLETWVNKQKDSLGYQFVPTSSGIWIRFIKEKGSPKAKINNKVLYTAEIRSLSNKIIYSYSEFGTKGGVLSKFKEIRGIESALYMMGKGDEVEALLPSFTAYGLYGDEKKIGANVPLLVNLQMLDIKN